MQNSFWKRCTSILTAIVFVIICTACSRSEGEQSVSGSVIEAYSTAGKIIFHKTKLGDIQIVDFRV